jgi:hypothetical protein
MAAVQADAQMAANSAPVLAVFGDHPGRQRVRRLTGAIALTCADSAGRGWSAGVFAGARGLLMRFGFAPIRGSNPRASAILARDFAPVAQSR